MGRNAKASKATKPYRERTATETLVAFAKDLSTAVSNTPFHVFLCGPSLTSRTPSNAAKLRKKIKTSLERDGFKVFLGEDDGLEDARLRIGLNAQDNELEFIRSMCNAIIVVAESPGSFCELGLFSWHFSHKNGRLYDRPPAFHLVVGKKYQKRRSYLNEGPATSVKTFGHVHYIDFAKADFAEVVKNLRQRRSIFAMDRRGRPRSRA